MPNVSRMKNYVNVVLTPELMTRQMEQNKKSRKPIDFQQTYQMGKDDLSNEWC